MESSYLQERKIISICFNPIRDSIFILSNQHERMELTEEDLSKNIILQRFKLLKPTQCFIQNNNYRVLPKDTFEGYSLYFWELKSKIIVIYPFGYLLIYDYITAQLEYHFQCHGRKAYVIRNIIGSPIQENLFISAEGMRNVYLFNYSTIANGVIYQKLVLPQNENVYDIICHPNEKFVFIACTDSIVHIFDYSDPTKIREIKTGIVDYQMSADGKTAKNQAELIKKASLQSVISIDINSTGNYLLSGNENGVVYLWDAFLAMKDKCILISKQRISVSGIFSVKFLKTKQFQNLDRFICLTKEGKFFIYSIMSKETVSVASPTITATVNLSTTQPKTYIFDLLYENSTYNPIIYPLMKYNIIPSNFINISYYANVISLMWPNFKLEKIKTGDKYENYLLLTNLSAKFFFLYDNYFPKINFALSTQMKYRSYEEYIPSSKKMLIYESRIFMIDNFFIYDYEIVTGKYKKLLNYTKEFNLKSLYPLRFEVKENQSDIYFLILIENENYKKSGLFIHYDTISNIVKSKERIEDIIDFLILGNQDEKSNFVYMISKDKQNGIIYSITEKKKLVKGIDASVVRVYNTPFNNGYCVLYRNVLNELKFSANLIEEDQFAFKCINDNTFKLDFSEREIDVIFNVSI